MRSDPIHHPGRDVLYPNTPKPAAETDEGGGRAKAYRLALGEFIDAFAKVEVAMYLALRFHARATVPIARAVFSGVRVDTAMSFLRRLADVESMDVDEWLLLEPILDQLRKINDARNSILHHGAQGVEEGRAFVTDAVRALTEDRMKIFPISPDILNNMSYDCRKIFLHLATRHMGRAKLTGQHSDLDEVLDAAWRYIPAPPPRTARAGKSPKPQASRRRSTPRQHES